MQTSKILNEVLVLSLPYTGRYFTYVTGGRHFSFVLRLWNSSPQEERNNAPAGRLSLKRTVQLFQAVNTKQTQPWKSECHTLLTWSSAALLLQGQKPLCLDLWDQQVISLHLSPRSPLLLCLPAAACDMLDADWWCPRGPPTWGTHITFSSCCH